jgi:glycosyltransferase involved in cell wall biosynthesis
MVDKIITVCEADRQLALSVKVGRKCLIVAINNGMPDITEDLIANPINKLPKIVMVARFEKQKDHITLIKALKELKHFDWELELVGSGPLVDQVQFLVEKYNLKERVKFLGRRDDVPEILSAADIFVLASFWEGFPRSILEAMRAALPIIASAVAGVPEAVNDLETGFLVRPGDVVQTRERLRSLLLDPELRKRLGANGRIKYENQFTFECMANKTLNVYESVLAK